MHVGFESTLTLDATVDEQLPKLGLAFVVDEAAHTWGITRSTQGDSFEALTPGRRVRLLVQSHPTYSVVQECRLVE